MNLFSFHLRHPFLINSSKVYFLKSLPCWQSFQWDSSIFRLNCYSSRFLVIFKFPHLVCFIKTLLQFSGIDHPFPPKKCQAPVIFGPGHSGTAWGPQWGQILVQKLRPWLWIWGTLVKQESFQIKYSGIAEMMVFHKQNYQVCRNIRAKGTATTSEEMLDSNPASIYYRYVLKNCINPSQETNLLCSRRDNHQDKCNLLNCSSTEVVHKQYYSNNAMLLGKGQKKNHSGKYNQAK